MRCAELVTMLGKSKLNTIKFDKQLSIFIMLEIYLPAVKYFIIHSISGLVQYNTIANYFLGIIFLFYFLCLIPKIIKKNIGFLLIPAAVVFFLYAFTLLFYQNNQKNLMGATIDIIIISYCLFVSCLCLERYEYLHKVMSRYAVVVVAFAVICAVFSIKNGLRAADFTSYDMSISYFCLIPTLFCFCNIKKDKWLINLLGFVAGLIVVLALGSRGTLIAIAFFVLLYILRMANTRKKTLFIFLLLALILIVVILKNPILNLLVSVLDKLGVNSRSISRLLYGGFWDTSNRNIIAGDALSRILDNPFGIGFMGDLSCHNIIIENFLWFGWILGGLFNLLFFGSVFFLFFKYKIKKESDLVIIVFASYAIIDALLNLTVWGKDSFWVYFAMVIAINLKKKKGVCYEHDSNYRVQAETLWWNRTLSH